MTKKRVIHPEGFPDYSRYTFSQGVEKSGIVWLSGVTASRYDPQAGRAVYTGDLAEQTRAAYEKVRLILQATGYSLKDVVKIVYYIAPDALPNFNQAIGVRGELFGVEGFPAVTAIAMEQLLHPDALVELEAVAHPVSKQWVHYPDPKNDWRLPFKPSRDGGEVLWFAGMVARSYDDLGNPHFPGGIVTQTRAIYQRAQRILEAAGLGFQDVVKTVDYLLPEALKGYEETAAVRREFFGDAFPASTAFVINQLLVPTLAEIDMFAVRGGQRLAVNPGWAYYDRVTFQPGVKKGNLLFITGQTGVDPNTGKLVGEGDVVAQARQALGNIKAVVEAAGGTMADVVRTIDYVTAEALPRYKETAAVRRELFRDEFPSATGVVVRQLLRPGALVEIQAIADLA